jgi:hypothetical protein
MSGRNIGAVKLSKQSMRVMKNNPALSEIIGKLMGTILGLKEEQNRLTEILNDSSEFEKFSLSETKEEIETLLTEIKQALKEDDVIVLNDVPKDIIEKLSQSESGLFSHNEDYEYGEES